MGMDNCTTATSPLLDAIQIQFQRAKSLRVNSNWDLALGPTADGFWPMLPPNSEMVDVDGLVFFALKRVPGQHLFG